MFIWDNWDIPMAPGFGPVTAYIYLLLLYFSGTFANEPNVMNASQEGARTHAPGPHWYGGWWGEEATARKVVGGRIQRRGRL